MSHLSQVNWCSKVYKDIFFYHFGFCTLFNMYLNIPNLALGVHWAKLLWTFPSSQTTKSSRHVSSSKLMLNYVTVILFNPSRLFKKTCDWSAALSHHMTTTGLAMDWALQLQSLALMCSCMSLVSGCPVLQQRTCSEGLFPEGTQCTSCPVRQAQELRPRRESPKKQAPISGLFGQEIFALLAVAWLH